MSKTSARPEEVLQAVRHAAETMTGPWIEQGFPFARQIAIALGVDTNDATLRDWDQNKAWDKFYGQVGRALNKLAAEGVLRKAGIDTRGPDGHTVYRNSVKYWTPAAWDRAEARHAEEQAARQAASARADALLDRLGKLGIDANERNGWVSMDLDSWQALLDLAELGTKLPTAVRFAHPDAGYEAAQQMAARHLEPGKTYPLSRLEVGQSSSYVELANKPRDVHFSSVLFEPAKDWDE